MKKIRIITDSAADFQETHSDKLTVLPMHIRFDEEEYLDGVTITHQEFYEKLVSCDSLPITSLISPAVFEDAYEKAVNANEQVIVITVSSKLSGTYQSAILAAERFSNDVIVIDSMNATIGEQILVQYALNLIDENYSFHDIVEKTEHIKHKIHILALLDTLDYLKKGGRISKSVAFVGGVLSLKPVVTITDGEVRLLGTARGSRSGNNYLMKEVENIGGIDFEKPFLLGYSGNDASILNNYIESSTKLWKDFTQVLPKCSVGATIGTHVGPGAIAVAFFEKE